ncbi:hypothetical protein AtubIFM57258_001020 [Aspergillus tubingensis]|nr:hypothetical protein AtubIFM57258_001020 [Aspergillus tubingensis]
MILTKYIAVFTVAVTSALGASQADQTVSDIQAIYGKVASARQNLDGYDGGILSAITVAKSLYDTQKATETARRNLDASDEFSSEDGEKVAAAFNGLHAESLDTMRLASEKASLFQGAGVSLVGRAMLNRMHKEKKAFDEALMKRVPDEHHDRIEPSQDEMNGAYEDVFRAFS